MIAFLKKHYWIFLLLTVLISYGQLLFMFPWQDDHTIFFKLQHISETAGFFGTGPYGQGAYKYIITPHILIYKMFGSQPIVHFAFGILMYYLAILLIYRVFSTMFDKKIGRVAGFVFAAGYVASDGFIRIFNSVATSFSIIFALLLFFFYWKFYKNKNYIFYFLSILFYYFAIEFTRLRTHYLISVAILFELIFLCSKKKLIKSVSWSLLRLVPFFYIFYSYFLKDVDPRAAQLKPFLLSLLKGDFYQLYSFFSGITNIFFPDWLLKFVSEFKYLSFVYVFITLAGTYVFYSLIKKKCKKRKMLAVIFFFISILWIYLAKKIFNSPLLNLGALGYLEVFLAGELLLLSPFLLLLFKKNERRYKAVLIFFLLWAVFNIASYSVYNPSLGFTQFHRYLAHSFLALVGLLAILSDRNKILYGLVVCWGVINLTSSFVYQNTILRTRSYPVKLFYKQLKTQIPLIEKGDVIYIDVAENARKRFADAFSVASMPEETAIAWQYGIDRYDFRMFSDYDDFIDVLKSGIITDIDDKPLDIKNVYTFFYSDQSLISTTNDYHKLKNGFQEKEIVNVQDLSKQYDFLGSYSCLMRPTLTLSLSANYLENVDVSNFPAILAGSYADSKKQFYANSEGIVSSSWKDRTLENIFDQNPDTVWQAHRVTWDKEKTYFGFDLKTPQVVDKFVWINGFGNNTPTSYSIEVSLDGSNWTEMVDVEDLKRIDTPSINEIKFDPTRTRYIRMVIKETLNSDSAGISEAWVSPVKFEEYDIQYLEELVDSSEYAFLNNKSRTKIYWKSNSSEGWKTSQTSFLDLIVDNNMRNYSITIPCSGTRLESIKLESTQVPIKIQLKDILVTYDGNM